MIKEVDLKMIKKIFITILLVQISVFANITTDKIDINKKAITIILSNTYKQAKEIAQSLNRYDIYIYKTITTQKIYYILYAVNIEKQKQKQSLADIKRFYYDAYITSDSRVLELVNNKSLEYSKKEEKIKEVKIKKIIPITNKFLEIKKNTNNLFIGYTKNKHETARFIKRYNFHDIVIHVINKKYKDEFHYCAIYIVNIESDNLNFVSSYMKKYYLFSKIIKSSDINQLNNTNLPLKYIKKKSNNTIYQTDGCE